MTVKVRLVVEDSSRGTFDAEMITGQSFMADFGFRQAVVRSLVIKVSEEIDIPSARKNSMSIGSLGICGGCGMYGETGLTHIKNGTECGTYA